MVWIGAGSSLVPRLSSPRVVDVVSEEAKFAPRRVLDHDYEIRFCQAEPYEDPARNKADAEREALTELQLAS